MVERTGKRRKVFDKAYYDRFYHDPGTRVISEESMSRLGDFVCAYLVHMEVEVASVLDLGCGLGPWRDVIASHFPHARYTGVEVSEYLCRTYGWEHGSIVDYRSPQAFDLVICQGVLQYLGDREAARAITNLGTLCRSAMFLEVLTRQDWEENCDQSATDRHCHLRDAGWYATRLYKHFINCGGGVYLSKRCEHYVYALDHVGS